MLQWKNRPEVEASRSGKVRDLVAREITRAHAHEQQMGIVVDTVNAVAGPAGERLPPDVTVLKIIENADSMDCSERPVRR